MRSNPLKILLIVLFVLCALVPGSTLAQAAPEGQLFFIASDPQRVGNDGLYKYENGEITQILMTQDIQGMMGLAIWQERQRVLLSAIRTSPNLESNSFEHIILSIDYTGSSQEVILVNDHLADRDKSLQIHPTSHVLYYKSNNLASIFAMNLNFPGSVTTFANGLNGLADIVLAPEENEMIVYQVTDAQWRVSRFSLLDGGGEGEPLQYFGSGIDNLNLVYNDAVRTEVTFTDSSFFQGPIKGFYTDTTGGASRDLSQGNFTNVVDTSVDQVNRAFFIAHDSGNQIDVLKFAFGIPAPTTSFITRADLDTANVGRISDIAVVSSGNGGGGSVTVAAAQEEATQAEVHLMVMMVMMTGEMGLAAKVMTVMPPILMRME